MLASGVTAIAGFAVLIASDIAMLRDFGLVTVIDLAVSLLGVLAVLPAVLVLAERRAGREPAGARRRAPRRRGMKARPGLLLAVFVGRAARLDHAQLGGDRDGGLGGPAGRG